MICNIIFIICFLFGNALSQDVSSDSSVVQDSWFGFDKLQHASFSCLWILAVQYIAVNKSSMAENDALRISFSSAASLGLLKEFYDRKRLGRHFCKKDLIADALGLGLATAIVLSNPGQ